MRLELGVHGANVTIFELRPPWSPKVGPEGSRRPVAQLRHTGWRWLLAIALAGPSSTLGALPARARCDQRSRCASCRAE
jgi:hypothetical protein